MRDGDQHDAEDADGDGCDRAEARPLAEEDLNTLFGNKDGFALADSAANLKRVQRTARVGRELFPWIMALILVLVTAENYLANRFHRERGTASVLRPRAMAAGARSVETIVRSMDARRSYSTVTDLARFLG